MPPICLWFPLGFQPCCDWLLIGYIFPVEMGRFLDFQLFLYYSPHSTTSSAEKFKFVDLLVYFLYFFFIKIQILIVKVGLWLVDIRLENWGTLLCRGFLFLGKLCNSWIPHVKLHTIRYFFAMESWIINFQFVFRGSPQFWYCERRFSFVSC